MCGPGLEGSSRRSSSSSSRGGASQTRRARSLPGLLLAGCLTTICFVAGVLPGCSAPEKVIVMVEEAKVPEELKGYLEIADERPVRVTVLGHPEIVAERPLPGRVVLNKSELRRFLRALEAETRRSE